MSKVQRVKLLCRLAPDGHTKLADPAAADKQPNKLRSFDSDFIDGELDEAFAGVRHFPGAQASRGDD